MAKKKTSASNRPFLYIVQPDFEQGDTKMQDYIIKKNEKVQQQATTRIMRVKKESGKAKKDTEFDKSSLSNFKKNFQDLGLKERVDLLLTIPKERPQYPCALIVNGEMIEGTVLEKDDATVSFQLSEGQAVKKYDWNVIDDVHML
ncbi:hypothetical protein [Bacillus solimangrovi]|uniref:Spore coat protein CotO n=1 Tax=Bacillus solimangrovi TaxID=1305675 RepID=A0A1E5LBY2_9BACI|nr:hypothetical protein [Bacillus solimangrovi]OEH91596.1 hypothetical protein BFG57_04270 [Bacillus solimangrovi]